MVGIPLLNSATTFVTPDRSLEAKIVCDSLMTRLQQVKRLNERLAAKKAARINAVDTWNHIRDFENIMRRRKREQFARAQWANRSILSHVIITNYEETVEERHYQASKQYGDIDSLTEKQAFVYATKLSLTKTEQKGMRALAVV